MDRLERLRKLVSVVHVRAHASTTVGSWHDGFHSLADSLIADGLRQAGVAEADVEPVSRISTFVVEGLLSHPQDEQAQAAVVRLLGALGTPAGDQRPSGPVGRRRPPRVGRGAP